jgi:hypothetical protein
LGGLRPVEQVSGEDCQQFLERLKPRLEGFAPRLPTEAEWLPRLKAFLDYWREKHQG